MAREVGGRVGMREGLRENESASKIRILSQWLVKAIVVWYLCGQVKKSARPLCN